MAGIDDSCDVSDEGSDSGAVMSVCCFAGEGAGE